MVSEQDKAALRESMPELLSSRLGITDLRRSFRCPSPAHDDRDPSAHYYPNDNTVHCFGCGKTWDVFSLMGELDGIEGFAEQARAVADLIGYHLDEGEDQPRPRRKYRPKAKPRPLFDPPREAGGADCGDACSRAYDQLYEAKSDIGRRYLRWRGLDDWDVMRHGLGFTTNPTEVMPEFKVWEPKAFGFITIPFWNEDCSEARYCMLRTVCKPGDARNKEWRPAGIATPLWNEWMLTASLDVVYVAEGLVDAMALTKVLDADVMALGGVSNAKRLSQVLYATPAELRPKKVVVCMDEDDEGHKTRDRICADLAKLRVSHSVLPAYEGGAKDADEWLMAGKGKGWEFEPVTYREGDRPLWRTRWL